MKIDFVHTGDVHSFVMAMMQDREFTLKGEKKELRIRPNLKQGGFSIKSANVNSEMMMTIPVKLLDFDGEATMTFQYNVEDVVVADAVAPVAEVIGVEATVGFLCEEITYNPEATGIRPLQLNADNSPALVDGLLVGARKFPAVVGHSAIEGRPATKVTKFTRGVRHYYGLPIKFE